MRAKCVKMIGKRSFCLSLMETSDGYHILVEKSGEKEHRSETLKSLNIALYLFDIKLVDLEGI